MNSISFRDCSSITGSSRSLFAEWHLLTSSTGDVAVQPGEDEIAVLEVLGLTVADNKVAQGLRHRSGLLPLNSILVHFAGRALRCTESVELQKRVLCEKEDKSLANRARSSEDTCSS